MIEAMRQLEALLSSSTAVPARFAPNSRYSGLPALRLELPDGRTVAYVARRFIPGPEEFLAVREHLVVQGDRLDSLGALYLGDPELWWKIADANVALVPVELTDSIGATLRIALPGAPPGGKGVV